MKKKPYNLPLIEWGKIQLAMKLTIILILAGVMKVSASAYSQKVKFVLNLHQASVEQVFEEIKNQSDFNFLYRSDLIREIPKVSVNLQKVSIEKVLDKILVPHQITYEIHDKTIIIRKKENQKKDETTLLDQVNAIDISGTVTDQNGEPIPGVTVHVQGTINGAVTDIDGNFSLDVEKGDILIFSFIGYEKTTVVVQNQTTIDVILSPDMQSLEEVVVIGYGSVKKSNLTGAVSSVKMDDLPQIATTNVANILTGRVPGLSIRQNSATPGGGYDMVIRGAASTGAGNAPLFVIDGFPGGDINTVNPSDIESVEVLKDASATAIYGARAANGVILINTKKGKAGTMNINFNSSASLQNMANPYEMVSTRDYMTMSNDFFREEWLYNNKIAPYGNADPSTITSTPKIAFTDQEIANVLQETVWFDEITRQGIINEQNVSINGGEGNVRYLFSLGHLGHKGVVVNSGFGQYLGRLNLELDLSKWLTTGISISATQTTRDNIAQSSNPNSVGMIRDAMMYPQYLPIYDDQGNYTINPGHASTANPVSWGEVENRNNTFRTLINNFWKVRLSDNLDFRVNMGTNASFGQNTYFVPKSHLIGAQMNTLASISEERRNDYLLDATLTYTKELFGNHRLNGVLGYAYQTFNTRFVRAENSDFITDLFGPWNLAAGGDLTRVVGSDRSLTKYLSYFGRVNYDIADKYLFTFTFRTDGSDRFGKENKFGYFPSGAFAWRLIEEDFMKGQNLVSNLKLRVSAGQTGNASIGGNTYGFYASGANYVLGNAFVTGISENQLANPKLKWETTTEYNLGLDWGLFNDRLTGSIEYYQKAISDLLDSRPVGSYYPVESVADNLGKTQSKGFEISLRSVNVSKSNFTWSTDLNLYQYKDSWRERNPYSILAIYQGVTDPLHVSYGYLSDGLIQPGETVSHMPNAPAGSIKVQDLNGWLKDTGGDFILDGDGKRQLSGESDGAIDDADKVIIHNQAPKFSFGLNNTFTYKGFDLGIFFYGEVGRQLNNVTRMDFLRADKFRFSDNVTTDSFDRWSSTNPDGKYPTGLFPTFESGTDFYIEKADFVRLKNLTLGYTLPNSFAQGRFKNSRVYVDAQNLFVMTNYTGSDPETDSFSAYPNQRTYSLGVNLSF
ncbi:TonB-dependent receptor [Algoriphagus sp. D3-2-R+10]|uniref:TonB-dependent receptor n=1 Tax=Algoriphagus aurantiacus TaxID=3103948 RepID=UPI002B36E964|nr:TonB-dependent receptor [Algoriphagus sp. D3-2-R+10]MEB2774676.1 TonB-dependent receptor [Algoriphagus sp. D3-2-R+10]